MSGDVAREPVYRGLVCGFLAACLLLGGASAAGFAANFILQLGAIGLSVVALQRLSGAGLEPRHRVALGLMLGVLVLPLLQLIPLAPETWSSLPGRQVLVDGFGKLGMPLPWLPLSLDPAATLASWLSLLPAVAIFLAVLSLDPADRVWIGVTILVVAVISTFLAIIQFASATGYFYAVTSRGHGVGFFANRNHLATLILVGIPTLTLHLPGMKVQPFAAGRGRSSNDLLAVALLAILLLGLLAAGSRAGLGLAIPMIMTSIGLRLRAHSGESPFRLIVAAGGLSLAVLAAVAFGPWLSRLAAKTAELGEGETRLIAAPLTLNAGWDNFPFGTGFGTFDPVFRLIGGEANLGSNFINHAHNEYIEFWLTGGLPAMVLLAGFLWWFAGAAPASWRARADNAGGIPRVAAVTIAVILIHSLVDYPLRTAAISAIFAACCALLLEPVRRSAALGRGAHPFRRPGTTAIDFAPAAARAARTTPHTTTSDPRQAATVVSTPT